MERRVDEDPADESRAAPIAGAMAAYGIKNQQERFAAQMVEHMSTTDQTVIARREVLYVFVEASRESYAQGGRANTREARLLGRPWGFDPAVVGVDAHLWYGGEDSVVPVSAGRWLADRIPDSRFVLWPLHGHVTWKVADEAAEVVQTLVG
jgi:pimeloyl-ACP methyl ester carboxylesterase